MAATATAEQLLRVDPGTLIIADNIRKTVALDPGFVSSIKQHGVRVPIEVEPGEDGTWIVIDGQLRTLAAMDAGLADVPIVTTGTREAAARITEQLIINDHRSGVTDSDRTAAYQALFELGVPASTIAKKTNTPIKRVQTALAVAGSRYASEVIAAGNVTLDQAAAIVEFEDESELAEELATTALERPDQFNHLLVRLQKERASANQKAQLLEQLAFEGYTVTEEFLWTVSTVTAMGIEKLYTDEKLKTRLANSAKQRLTPFDGLKAVLVESQEYDQELHGYVSSWWAAFIVDGWKELGYFVDEWRIRDDKPAGGGLTDAEREKRKETRENNKLWVPATEVRRAWLIELLQRKELPAGWEMFVAQYVARANPENNYTFALKLLGGGTGGVKWLADNPARAAHFLIAHAIASVEDRYEFGKSGWRDSLAPAYMRQLSKWGYTMSDLEESVSKGSGK